MVRFREYLVIVWPTILLALRIGSIGHNIIEHPIFGKPHKSITAHLSLPAKGAFLDNRHH